MISGQQIAVTGASSWRGTILGIHYSQELYLLFYMEEEDTLGG